MINELLGKMYPIKNEENEIIGYKPITKVITLENVAGAAIGLDGSEASIILSFGAILELLNNSSKDD